MLLMIRDLQVCTRLASLSTGLFQSVSLPADRLTPSKWAEGIQVKIADVFAQLAAWQDAKTKWRNAIDLSKQKRVSQ